MVMHFWIVQVGGIGRQASSIRFSEDDNDDDDADDNDDDGDASARYLIWLMTIGSSIHLSETPLVRTIPPQSAIPLVRERRKNSS